jgi:hypothetical protein
MAQERPKQLDSPLLPKIFKYVGKAHVWVYRRTGGKIGGKWRIGAGFRKPVPTLLLEHRGRKSGKGVRHTAALYARRAQRRTPTSRSAQSAARYTR